MPMYEYECAACGHRFERIQKFSDSPIEECPSCGERKVQKLLSSPAIQFKGSGWYINDYAKKGAQGTDAKADASIEGKDKDTKGSSESKESGQSKEAGESKESRESKESKESKESRPSKESRESKESKTAAPASTTASTPKASGQ